MFGWVRSLFDWFNSLIEGWETWQIILAGVGVFAFFGVGGLLIVRAIVIRLPTDYLYPDRHRPEDEGPQNPVARWGLWLFRNILGLVLVVIGTLLSIPGIPGPGILTIAIGVMVMDFPGKRRLECWALSRKWVLEQANRMRVNNGRKPFRVPEGGAEVCAR